MPVRLLRWSAKELVAHRFLRLTHLGRFSGCRHQSMLEISGGTGSTPEEITVSTGMGQGRGWYRNVQARPALEVARHRLARELTLLAFRPDDASTDLQRSLMSNARTVGDPGRAT